MSEVTLYEGDCLEVMPTLAGPVDLILADLPYGTTACKWDTVIPLEPLWAQYKRLIKRNGAIVLTASQPFTTTLIASNRGMFRYCWVWNKVRGVGHLNAKNQPMRQTEDVLVFYDRRGTYNPQMRDRPCPRQSKNHGTHTVWGTTVQSYIGETLTQRYPTNLLTVSKSSAEEMLAHPTQKPVALMEYLVRTYTNEGDVVLDNTMGSGTTGVACVNTGRHFIGIERDSGYFAIAQRRIEAAQQAARQAEFAA